MFLRMCADMLRRAIRTSSVLPVLRPIRKLLDFDVQGIMGLLDFDLPGMLIFLDFELVGRYLLFPFVEVKKFQTCSCTIDIYTYTG